MSFGGLLLDPPVANVPRRRASISARHRAVEPLAASSDGATEAILLTRGISVPRRPRERVAAKAVAWADDGAYRPKVENHTQGSS
jgi:hypothetical protein